jgi:biotin transport system substrate-specific component
LNWSGALAGLLLLITGGLLHPAWLQWSDSSGWQSINLGVTAQLPALLLTALICGPRPALMAAIAYLALGLSGVLMVFHSGGGLSYLQLPAFGYIAGFLPAAWLCGRLAQRDDVNQLEHLMAIALLGVMTVQLCGGLNLVVGHWAGRWAEPLPQLLLSYGLLPLGGQILLCAVVAVVSRLLRPLLTVNH